MALRLMHRLPKKERSVINNHIFHNVTRFAVNVKEYQERLPTFYWLPTLHKQLYKARFIANSTNHYYRTIKIANLLSYYYQKTCYQIL